MCDENKGRIYGGREDGRGRNGWERWIQVPNLRIINKCLFFSSSFNSLSEASLVGLKTKEAIFLLRPVLVVIPPPGWISDSETFSLLRLLIGFYPPPFFFSFFFALADLIFILKLLYIIRPGLRLSGSSPKAAEKHPWGLSSLSLLCLSSCASLCSGWWRRKESIFPLFRLRGVRETPCCCLRYYPSLNRSQEISERLRGRSNSPHSGASAGRLTQVFVDSDKQIGFFSDRFTVTS